MADKQAVPNGAYLLCDKGAKPGQLTVTPNGVSYYGESSATEFDALPVLNVPDFGACLILKKCVPATALWQGVVENGVTIGRGRPLKDDSMLPCAVGGTVRIFMSLAAATAAATAAASNHAAAEEAKAEAKEAKKDASLLFWAGVGLAAVVGIAAIALTGGAAAPLVALAAEVALDAAIGGAVAGAVAGGVAGGIDGYNSGGLEGAAEGILPGAAAGALMGGAAGVVTALGGGALLLPSVAAFGYGVYEDSRAMYYEPSVGSGLVLFSDVFTVVVAAKSEALVREGLAGPESQGIIINNPGFGDVRPAEFVRDIARNEKIADIESEAKYRTFSEGVEHAVIKTAEGKRIMVSGGSKGIELPRDTKVLYGHTHPPVRKGAINDPSEADRNALDALNQSKQYIYHDGQRTVLYRNGEKVTTSDYDTKRSE